MPEEPSSTLPRRTLDRLDAIELAIAVVASLGGSRALERMDWVSRALEQQRASKASSGGGYPDEFVDTFNRIRALKGTMARKYPNRPR